MTSHSDGVATDNDRAAVVATVATVSGGAGDGAVAAVGTVATDGIAAVSVIDDTVADTGSVKKQNFHTGLDPVSREDNCAQRSLSAVASAALNSVGCAELFILDTGSSPVWSVVADTVATDDDRAVVAGTVVTAGTTSATVATPSPHAITVRRHRQRQQQQQPWRRWRHRV